MSHVSRLSKEWEATQLGLQSHKQLALGQRKALQVGQLPVQRPGAGKIWSREVKEMKLWQVSPRLSARTVLPSMVARAIRHSGYLNLN